mmetsp:Transcript_8394/g.16010  ORF Transcript_8394/g.16010 Transcript_8394/m.16010 type:complete len:259 (-) Transcript_8394:167-943(-)
MSSLRFLEGGLLDQNSLQRQLTTSLALFETRILSAGEADDNVAGPSSATGNSSSSVPDDNAVMIAWYAFIGFAALVLGSLAILFAYKMYFQRVRGPALEARREEQSAIREAVLARMQANISKFTAQEDKQRTRDLCTLLRPQTMIMQAGDPRLSKCSKDTSECSTIGDDNEESILDIEQGSSSCVPGVSPASCCLICLEGWREGEMICQSAGCPHIFHQPCIVSWLVHHRDCPACRQTFLPDSSQEDKEEEEADEYHA